MIQTKGVDGIWYFQPSIKTLILYTHEVEKAHPHFTALELKEELLKNMRDCDCKHKEKYNGWADITVSEIIDKLVACFTIIKETPTVSATLTDYIHRKNFN